MLSVLNVTIKLFYEYEKYGVICPLNTTVTRNAKPSRYELLNSQFINLKERSKMQSYFYKVTVKIV